MNPLAPGPWPGTPVFEWHTRTVSCAFRFTDAEAEEAEERRRKRVERDQRRREAQRRVAELERERNAALHKLPAIEPPSREKSRITTDGCAIGCGLWIGLMLVVLIALGATGQLAGDTDPTIFGIENPLLLLPATWLAGWIIALIRAVRARQAHRTAVAKAKQRASERARIQADFDRRIATVERAAQQ